MTVEELIEVVKGLPGRTVEATVAVGEVDERRHFLTAFSGTVAKVTHWKAPTEHWTIWWEQDGAPKPREGSVTIWRNGYEHAEVKGSGRTLEEVETEDDAETGTLWEIWIWQSGTVMELLVYV